MPPKMDPTVTAKAQAPTASDPGSGSATVIASGEGLINVFASVTITANKAVATAKAVTPTATVEVTAVSDSDTVTEPVADSIDHADIIVVQQRPVMNSGHFGGSPGMAPPKHLPSEKK